MPSRRLEDLTQRMQGKALRFFHLERQRGREYIVTCTLRTKDEQAALYAQGRYPLESVNGKRKVAGLPPISKEENRHPVTWTVFHSRHLPLDEDGARSPGDVGKAEALDVARMKGGKVTWDPKEYEGMGEAAKECGLRWGGNFTKADLCHLEDDGLDLDEAETAS